MNVVSSSNKRKQNSFDIVIVEDHNQVLEAIYKEIGRRRLNFSNLTLLHFDSHPDLGIPDKLQADSIYDKHAVFEQISIESWILPAVFAGHISTVIWVKPSWSTQIDPGLYYINIGKHSTSGLIKCDSRESYFLSENAYAGQTSLVNTRCFTLYVCNFHDVYNGGDNVLLDLLKNTATNQLIFDVDLDFFSTMDPFKLMFACDSEYELFKSIYENKMELSKTDLEFDEKYEKLIKIKQARLDEIFYSLKERLNNPEFVLNDKLNQLGTLISSKNLDLEILHSFGAGLDDRPLPDHVSNEEEILKMSQQFNLFLVHYLAEDKAIPALVTIARSSLDDYCPPKQVEFIQEQILNSIKQQLKSYINSIQLNYSY